MTIKEVAYLISVCFFIVPHLMNREYELPYLFELIMATILLTITYHLTKSIWSGILLHMILDVYLSLTSIGDNSGLLIRMVDFYDYNTYDRIHSYTAATINTVVLIVIIIIIKKVKI